MVPVSLLPSRLRVTLTLTPSQAPLRRGTRRSTKCRLWPHPESPLAEEVQTPGSQPPR